MSICPSTSRNGSFVVAAFMLVGILPIVGCSNGPKLIDVTGTLMVDGKPAEGATLLFHPKNVKNGIVASAVTGADGKFKFMSDLRPGIPVGSYDVTLTWPDPSVKPTESQRMQGLFDGGPDLLKGKYSMLGTSGLVQEVTASSKDLPPIELSTN